MDAMALPIVVVLTNGIAVTEASNGKGLAVQPVANGKGTPVVIVTNGFGLPVVGNGNAPQ
jgi:hypothetical protein